MITLRPFVDWAINYKKRINGSLTAKTFFLVLVLFLVISFATYVFVILFLPYTNKEQARRQLDDKSKALVSELRMKTASDSSSVLIRFIQETGADLGLMNEKREAIDYITFKRSNDRILTGQEYPFRFADSKKEYILTVKFNTSRSEEISNALWHSLPWIGVLIMLLSFFSALIFSRYTTLPIIRMSKTAANIAELDFSWYCPDLREDEIGVLAKSLNELSDKLSDAISDLQQKNSSLQDEITMEKERERRRLLFFSGVSHELKTPIAIVIGQLEGMKAEIGVYKNKDKYLTRSADILRSLDSFIKEILIVSHMDISNKHLCESVDLSDVLASILRDCKALMKSRQIQLVNKMKHEVIISGDALLLKKALFNVISNAVIYSPEGETVCVSLTQENSETILEVTNSGVHIEDEHLTRLFEAFYRAENHTGSIAGKGSGMGLYITRMILENHGVPHTIENHKDGVKFRAVFLTKQI